MLLQIPVPAVSVGFGHALAIHLDRLGATVFAGCLVAEGSGAMKLKREGSDRMHVVQLDVRNAEQVAKCVQYVSTVTNGSGVYLKVLYYCIALARGCIKCCTLSVCPSIHPSHASDFLETVKPQKIQFSGNIALDKHN